MIGATSADDEAPAFMLPPPGTTNTPADMVTDPALNMLPNPNPTVITNWGLLPNGREWGSEIDITASLEDRTATRRSGAVSTLDIVSSCRRPRKKSGGQTPLNSPELP